MKVRIGDGPVLADGRGYTPLPASYYELTRRIAAALTMREEMARSDPLWQRLTDKIATLTAELQTVVDSVLGLAVCPTCSGVAVTKTTLHSLRVCCRHDLQVISLHGKLQREPPGTGEIRSSVSA